MPTTRPTFNSLLGGPVSGSFYVGSSIFWGFTGRFDSYFGSVEFAFKRDCGRCGPRASTVLTNPRRCASCGESHRPGFQCGHSPCFQRCFQLGHDCCHSRFPPAQVRLRDCHHLCLRFPPFLPPPALARGPWRGRSPIMAPHVTSISSHGESLVASCDKAFVVGPGHAPIPAKLVKKLSAASLWNWPTYCPPISVQST